MSTALWMWHSPCSIRCNRVSTLAPPSPPSFLTYRVSLTISVVTAQSTFFAYWGFLPNCATGCCPFFWIGPLSYLLMTLLGRPERCLMVPPFLPSFLLYTPSPSYASQSLETSVPSSCMLMMVPSLPLAPLFTLLPVLLHSTMRWSASGFSTVASLLT